MSEHTRTSAAPDQAARRRPEVDAPVRDTARRPHPHDVRRGLLTPDTLLAIQRHAGNRCVQRMVAAYAIPGARETQEGSGGAFPLIQRATRYQTPETPSSGGFVDRLGAAASTILGSRRGWVEVDDSGNPFTVKGTVYGSIGGAKGQESYAPDGSGEVSIFGKLEWEVAQDHDMLVVKDIYVSPKRTAVGNILMYHFAKLARARRVRFVGTALSALEEGTPEFYQKVGLEPFSMVGADMSSEADNLLRAEIASGKYPDANDPAAKKRHLYLRYSGGTRGSAETVLAKSAASFQRYWQPT